MTCGAVSASNVNNASDVHDAVDIHVYVANNQNDLGDEANQEKKVFVTNTSVPENEEYFADIDDEEKDDSGEPSGNMADEHSMNLDEFTLNMRKLIAVRKEVMNNIGIAQNRQKQQYNSKHQKDQHKHQVGTMVLLRNSKKLSRKCSKLEPNWTGPYKISEVLDKNTV